MKKHLKSKIFIILLVFLGLFLLNHLTWYTSDDFSYRYFLQNRFVTDSTREINSIPDFLHSQLNHYKSWNGRYIPHFILQIIMQMPKVVFNILNPIMFIILAVLLTKIVNTINKDSTKSVFYFISILTIMWFFIPEFGLSYLWVSGAINYTWLSIIYVGFLYYILKNNGNYNKFILPILAFLTGATNENTGPAVIIVVTLILLLFQYKEDKKTTKKNIILTVVFGILGLLSILLSPAAQQRGAMDMTILSLVENFSDIFYWAFLSFSTLYNIIVLLIFVLSLKKVLDVTDFKYIFIFIIGHLLSLFSLILSPEHPVRTFFGGAIFLFILFGYLIIKFFETTDNSKYIKIFCTFIMVFLLSGSYASNYIDVNKSHTIDKERFAIIEKAKEKGQTTAELPIYTNLQLNRNAMVGTANIAETEDAWINQWYAKWFDLDSVSGYLEK